MPKNMIDSKRIGSRFIDRLKGRYRMDSRGVSTIDIIIIVVAVIVIIVSGIFLYTNFRTLQQVNKDIEEMRTIIAEKQKTLDKLIELGQSEDVLKENYERNKLYVPDTKNEVGIVSDITGIVEDEGGKFRTITYAAETVKENGVTDVPFTIRVEATYEQLNEIVTRIGKTDRLYVIDSVTIVESGGSSVLIADISLHAYYKSEKSE